MIFILMICYFSENLFICVFSISVQSKKILRPGLKKASESINFKSLYDMGNYWMYECRWRVAVEYLIK